MAMERDEIVITGVGVLAPIGIGSEACLESLTAGESGIRRIESFDTSDFPVRIAGNLPDFNPREFVRPLKSLKVMSREAQMSVAAARFASEQANLDRDSLDPERLGVVFGADIVRLQFPEFDGSYRHAVQGGEFSYERFAKEGIFKDHPLGFLKTLPNMLACHVTIFLEAWGPNNTIQFREVSGLLAIAEAAHVIQRGQADVMVAGAASCRLHPLALARGILCEDLSQSKDPATGSRPFELNRSGEVRGEAAAAVVLERRRDAEARGATILARILGHGSSWGTQQIGLARAGRRALETAGVSAGELEYVSAHGLATRASDQGEAEAIRSLRSDLPVTALKSYFGNLGAASGAVELIANLLATSTGVIPATLNYDEPDPDCDVNVLHGQPQSYAGGPLLCWNATQVGQAAAIVVQPQA